MFRGLEHPSGFPSMLRGSTPEPRPLSRKDSYGSTHQLRRTDSNGGVATPTSLHRKDSSGSTALNRRDSFGTNYLPRKDSNGSSVLLRKDSNGSVLSRKDSTDLKHSNKRDSLNDDFRRLSFGNSIYLRPDSTGSTNLVRRDSFGRKDSLKSHRIPRDYVSKIFEYNFDTIVNGNANKTASPESSILRKSDSDQTNKENFHSDLTTANLSKHVNWEKDGAEASSNVDNIVGGGHSRRDSSGSLSNYLANRRISVDSLDVRRNSRRGSTASGDINLSSIIDNETQEVILQFIFFLL